MNQPDDMPFEVDDFLAFADQVEPEPEPELEPPAQEQVLSYSKLCTLLSRASVLLYLDSICVCSSRIRNAGSSSSSTKNSRAKVGFITKSEIETLDDGYRWRKYGKKKVKSNPNPR